jgi:precorrin-6Y C5,15-methyltransferase (decarboxylating)
MIEVIGLGLSAEHLPEASRSIVESADVLVGGRRQLALFPETQTRKLTVAAPLADTLRQIAEAHDQGLRVVVLAQGDPLNFGIGTTLVREFGVRNVRIRPNISALQAAAARLGRDWSGMRPVSLHGRDAWWRLFAALTHAELVCVFTDAVNHPGAIGKACLERGLVDCVVHVLEDLDGPQERTRRLTPAEAAEADHAEPSLVVVEQPCFRPPRIGLADTAFRQEQRLITKAPARAMGLHALALEPDSTLWDLGAGSGSVAIEAAALLREGRVLAVEARESRIADIRANIRRFGAWLVEPVQGRMPEALVDLPDPDRIFMGGGAREPAVLAAAMERLAPGGRLVVHAVLLETLESVRTRLAQAGWEHALIQLAASRSAALGGGTRLDALNPVFIVQANKPEAS